MQDIGMPRIEKQFQIFLCLRIFVLLWLIIYSGLKSERYIEKKGREFPAFSFEHIFLSPA